jgi:SPP1 family predicted phage head-tail adaptor
VNAGDLNQRIRIEQRVKSDNTKGEIAKGVWATLADVWANARPLRGREFFAAAQMQAELTTKFTIRYRTDVDETMRVIWKGEPYEIAAPPIEVGGGHEWIELMCKKGIGDGR